MKKLAMLVGLFSLSLLVAALPALGAPLAKPLPTPTPEAAAVSGPGCPATPLAEGSPPGPEFAESAGHWYGNDALWAAGGWPWSAGADGVKVAWYRAVPGELTITGRRLDGRGALIAHIPEGYGDAGLQVSGLYFPAGGCWEITGEVGARQLQFVRWVEPTGAEARSFPVVAGATSDALRPWAATSVDGHYAYVGVPGSDDPTAITVLMIDRRRMVPVTQKPWPAFCHRLLAIGARGDWICAYNEGNEGSLVRILSIDFERDQAPHTVGYVYPEVAGGAMITAGRLYVVTTTGVLTVFDANRGNVLERGRFPAPAGMALLPGQVLLSPDGLRLYLGYGRAGGPLGPVEVVRSYDTTRWNMVGSLDLAASPAAGLSLSGTGDRLFASDGLGRVNAYDTTTFQPSQSGW